MIALLLFFCVIAVGGLGLVALATVARDHLVARRREAERAAARAAQLAQTRQLEAEHARLLATLRQPRLAVGTPSAMVAQPIVEPVESVTSAIELLEQSARFARVAGPAPAPPVRSAKGSVPPPPVRELAPTRPPPLPRMTIPRLPRPSK